MASKADGQDQPAGTAGKSKSHPQRAPTGGASTEKLLKRSVPEEHRHNAQAPAEKKPKQKPPTDAVKCITAATTGGGDHSRQDGSIRSLSRLTSCSATQQLPQPESSHAHASTSTYPPPSDKSGSVSEPLELHALAASYWRNVAMQLSQPPTGVGYLQYSRPAEPTDNELYIFVTALRAFLTLAEQPIDKQSIVIMGDYLMQRNVLARLKGREDVSRPPAFSYSRNSSPKATD